MFMIGIVTVQKVLLYNNFSTLYKTASQAVQGLAFTVFLWKVMLLSLVKSIFPFIVVTPIP